LRRATKVDALFPVEKQNEGARLTAASSARSGGASGETFIGERGANQKASREDAEVLLVLGAARLERTAQ
jgi:hypothetical protein